MRKYFFIIIITGLLFNGVNLHVQGQQTNVKLTLNETFEETKRIRSLGKERRGEFVPEGSITVYMRHYMENGQQLLQLRVAPLLNNPEYRLLLFERGGVYMDIASDIFNAYGQRPTKGINLANYIYPFYNTVPGVLELRPASAYGFLMLERNLSDELVFLIDENSMPDINIFRLFLNFYLGSQNHNGGGITLLSAFEDIQYEIELTSFSSALAVADRLSDRISDRSPEPTPGQYTDTPTEVQQPVAQPALAEQSTQFIFTKTDNIKKIYSKLNDLRLNARHIDREKRQMLGLERAEAEGLKRRFDQSFNSLSEDNMRSFKSNQEIFNYYYDFTILNFDHLNIEAALDAGAGQVEVPAQTIDKSFRIMAYLLLILVILLAGFILFMRMRALRLKRKYTSQATPPEVKKAASKGRQAKGAAARAKRLTI